MIDMPNTGMTNLCGPRISRVTAKAGCSISANRHALTPCALARLANLATCSLTFLLLRSTGSFMTICIPRSPATFSACAKVPRPKSSSWYSTASLP